MYGFFVSTRAFPQIVEDHIDQLSVDECLQGFCPQYNITSFMYIISSPQLRNHKKYLLKEFG